MKKSIIVQTEFKSKPGEFDGLALATVLEKTLLGSRPELEFRTKKSFSPSSISQYGGGNCPRRWYIAFDGAEFQDDFDSVGISNMDNGNYVHDRFQKLFEDTGLLVEKEREILSDNPPIRGFADLIIKWNDKEVVGEIKSAKNEVFAIRKNKMEPINYHLVQLLIYMEVLGIDEGFFLYEDKNEMKIIIIPIVMNAKNKQIVTTILDWMREVHGTWKEQKLPTRPFVKRSKECAACPVRKACWNKYGEGEVTIPVASLPK